jgi:hypothetical protein
MATTMTVGQRRVRYAVSDYVGRAAWIHLAAGVLSILFGAVANDQTARTRSSR